MNPTAIEIPDRMKRFRLWKGKYPIHFTVYTDPVTSEPHFKVVSRARQIEAINKNLCHLCGQRMQPPYYFIGGPQCIAARQFVDGPMHIECATFACRICPFLASADAIYSGKCKEPNLTNLTMMAKPDELPGAGTPRPEKMGLAGTMGYRVDAREQYPKFVADPWESIDWQAMPQRKPC